MRKLFTLALCGLGLLTLGSPAQAAPITGLIQFGGTWSPTGGGIATATGIDFANTAFFPIVMDGSGTYAGLEGNSVVFTDFQFSPFVADVIPLWTFSSGGVTVTYSFDLTDVYPVVHQDGTSLVLAGEGLLHATGFVDTPADWNFSGNTAGVRFGFSAGNNAVPEPATLGLLGLGLVGLTAAGKKQIRRRA